VFRALARALLFYFVSAGFERAAVASRGRQGRHLQEDFTMTTQRIIWSSACAAVIAALTACASSPVPLEQLAVAKDSVRRAEQAGATELAPVELSTARDKLQRAQQAAQNHDGQIATRLADQANVDAQLAEATAREHKSHQAEMELQASLQALRQESSRDPGPPAPPMVVPVPVPPQPPTQ
jgi:septal ring factor EnvC (AmiA/AmiB activator)